MRLVLLVLLAACGSGGGFPDAKIDSSPPKGTFSADWTLTGTGGASVTCDDVGGVTVDVATHNRAVENGTTEVFTCSTLTGRSEALEVGTYDMAFDLASVSGVIATAPQQLGVVIADGANTQLAPLTFVVNATGGLALTISAVKPGGNCAPTAMMGAGITEMTLTLQHTGGACAPLTFAIAGDATRPPRTYTVNCAAPMASACIESDQQITVSGIASGNYTVHVVGKIGAASCYLNNDSLQVPAAGQTLTHQLNLAYQAGTPGC